MTTGAAWPATSRTSHAGRDRIAASGRAPARPALAGDQARAEHGPHLGADGAARLAAARLPVDPHRRHQRQDVGGPHGRRAADRVEPPHRPHHQPAPAVRGGAHLDRRQADHPGAVRGDLPRDRAVRAAGRPAVGGGGRPGDEQVRGRHRDGVRRVRRCARSTSPSSRSASAAAGTPPTSSTRRSPSSPRSASTTPTISATPSPRSPREKAGIITKQDDDLVPTDTVAVIARQVPEAMEVLLAQAVRADAAVAREDSEFAVLGRQVAVGGQLLELQGLGGVYSDIFLPLHGEHQAHNAVVALAAVEAFFGAGRGPAARHRRGAGRVRRGHQPRPAGTHAQRPNGVHRRRAQPGGCRRAGADAGRRSSTSDSSSASSR